MTRYVEPEVDVAFVTQVVAETGRRKDALIPILHALQEHYRYLPQAALRQVCRLTDITPADITGVSTFYDHFRHKPVGEHMVRVCCGTACHVKGAELVHEAVREHLGIPSDDDTDDARQYTLQKVACLGCCTLAPVMQVGEATYGYLAPGKIPDVFHDFEDRLRRGRTKRKEAPRTARVLEDGRFAEIRVGLGSCCMVKGSDTLFENIARAVADADAPARVKRVGCVGMCHRTPMVEVVLPKGDRHLYAQVSPERATSIVAKHFEPRGIGRKVRAAASWALDRLLMDEPKTGVKRFAIDVRDPQVSAFLDRQVHIATEHYGELDPLDLDAYQAAGGFRALRRCLKEIAPEDVIRTISESGLRGRGGAGFPTGRKWSLGRAAPGDVKYVIVNGDEGDPGAFMDRMILESYPYRVIEGLAIAAYAVGAHEGVFYIRAEYPLAVKRVGEALRVCGERGILGDRVLGTDFAFRVRIMQGAGAFVCGEETALIASVEGRRGMPTLRPPFPVERGLWEKPTVINNVETLASVPWILREGAARYSALGTAKSKGTKVFALAGKVARGGLIEVPMGITIREIVETIGGGIGGGRTFKAVQVGGPSGGCIPARLGDTAVDYEALLSVGAMMGSGGLVVLDETDCMVDIARYFLRFTQNQSCGKCSLCRVGTRRMLEILDRIAEGKGRAIDLGELESLAATVGAASICGLGRTAPNPVLTTLKYFRDEYEAHLAGRCPAGRCRALIRYTVTDRCTGCTRCAQHCPADAIPFTPYQKHEIDMTKCTRCDTCRGVCPEKAIEVK